MADEDSLQSGRTIRQSVETLNPDTAQSRFQLFGAVHRLLRSVVAFNFVNRKGLERARSDQIRDHYRVVFEQEHGHLTTTQKERD